MRTKLFLLVVLCAALLTLLPGCATDPVGAASKAGISTVTMDPHVDARQGMRYGADLSRGGGLANMLASAIVNSAGQSDLDRMSVVMQANNIVVADMVREQFVAELREHPGLTYVEGVADGTFIVTITQFGFDHMETGGSGKGPFILLRVELRNNQGRRIWSSEATPIQVESKGLTSTWNDYEANPEKLRADWALQISRIIKKAVPVSK